MSHLGSQPGNLIPSLLMQTQPDRELLEELGDQGERRANVRLPRVGIQVARDPLAENHIYAENVMLREELRRMHNVVLESKIDTAELYAKFGALAKDWSETVKQINAIHDVQRKEYEKRIKALEKTNQQLVKENDEMKKVIKSLRKLESEFEKQKRILKLGQIAFKLEILVSEYVFPGDDKASKRARYGTNLKSLKDRISNLKEESLKREAASRVEGLNDEMFEDWFLGIVKELKNLRLDSAHPDLGTYEEMKKMINEEYDDDDKREDMLKALDHLQEMYEKLNRPFGK